MVYKKTRFIADDKVVYQGVRRVIGFRQQLSTTSFEAYQLDSAVNYLCKLDRPMPVSYEISRADRCFFG